MSQRSTISLPKSDHSILSAWKERGGIASWGPALVDASKAHDLLARIRSAVGSGKLVIESKDGTRTEVIL